MKQKINKHNIKLALVSYVHTPKEFLKDIKKKNEKELLFHLENFALICNDDFDDVIKKYDINVNIK